MIKRGKMDLRRLLILLAFVLAVLAMPLASAEIEISKTTVHPIAIRELSLPAVVHFEVTPNADYDDYYYIDTLLDMRFAPSEIGGISAKSFKGFDVSIYPSREFKEDHYGNFAFEYYIRGDRTHLKKDALVISVLPMKEFADIEMPSSVTVDDKSMLLRISFKDDLNLKSDLRITSRLFEKQASVELSKKVQEMEIQLDSSDKDAGIYEADFEFTVGNETVVVKKEIILGPSMDTETSEKVSGNILSKEFIVTKTNAGNTPTKATVEMNKTIWTSLFTSYEGSPSIRREGTVYVYSWEKVINPRESLTAVLRINYYIPFLIFILLIVAFAVYKAVTTSQIEIKKTAMRVRTKSGLFASKIMISIRNKGGPVTNLKVIDHLPAFTELLPEKFGILEPSEIRKRSLIWEFPKIERADELMFSYIVYSKVTIFGKLEVPPALVTFIDRAGSIKEAFSNKLFILAEEPKMEKF